MGSVELGDPDQRVHSHTAKQQDVVKTTLWYRAPELLLGETRWTFAIDAWSLGCLGVELVQGVPLFPAKDEAELLKRIEMVFGSPLEGGGLSQLPFATPNLCQPRPRRHGRWRRCDPNTFCWTYSLDCWISNQLLACPVRRQKHRWLHQLPPRGVGECRYATRAILGDTWPSGRSRASMAAG